MYSDESGAQALQHRKTNGLKIGEEEASAAPCVWGITQVMPSKKNKFTNQPTK